MTDAAATLAARFTHIYGHAPDGVVRAPGRVNLIGEHTDYNDGFVLPVAIGVETRIAWRRSTAALVNVVALDFDGARDTVDVAAPVTMKPGGTWENYVRAMVAVLQGAGFALAGADLAITGTIQRGSGLSSSASLEVALAHALLAAARQSAAPADIARMAQRAENEFVGVQCGIMDPLASAAGVAGAALLIDCRSRDTTPVPLPESLAIMIIQSGVVRGLVDGHYNQRRAECEAAARALGLTSLRDANLAMLAAARATLDDTVFRRARHVVTENARVVEAAEALSQGDLARMGGLMAESHDSMRDDFEITVPAVDDLVAIAQTAIGAQGGARMTGGGFGGAVLALLPRAAVPQVAAAISARYRTPAGQPPQILIETARAGAGLLI